jgi:hypothetical protein
MLLADYQSFQQTPCISGCTFFSAAMFWQHEIWELLKNKLKLNYGQKIVSGYKQ